MTTNQVKTLVKAPAECSNSELAEFVDLVVAGGEVLRDGLPNRVRAAAVLAFALLDDVLVGVAALKHPEAAYRERVSSKSGYPLPVEKFSYELGWIYISPAARRIGLSVSLVHALFARVGNSNVFATARSDNVAIHGSLVKVGFNAVGTPYKSTRGDYALQVFSRHAAQP